MTDCLAAQRCRSGTSPHDPATNVPALAGDTPLCDADLEHATRALPLLVHDYRDLEQLLPPTMGVWPDPTTGYVKVRVIEAPIPMREEIEALQRRIWKLATTWAEVIADRHRLSDPPRGVRDGFAVAWAVRILAPRCDKLARLPLVQVVNYPHPDEDSTLLRSITLTYVSGAVGLLHLSRAHQHARAILGLTEPVYALPGHCQARGCGRAELRVKDGSDTVWCDRCGAQMTRDDYDKYGNLFLREAAA